MKRGRGHRSDQSAVWREVDRKARLHRATSPTHALQNSRSHLSAKLEAFEKLAEELPEGTRGVVVAFGDRPVLLEVLAGPRTFARISRKLLSGYAFEAVGLGGRHSTPSTSAVRGFIEAAAKAVHEVHRAVGSGRDLRFEEDGISGYALIGEESVLRAAPGFEALSFPIPLCPLRSEPGRREGARV